MTKNKVIHQSYIQKGLYLYKTGRSPFYFARIWNPKNKSKDKISYSTNKEGKKIRLYKSDGVEIK